MILLIFPAELPAENPKLMIGDCELVRISFSSRFNALSVSCLRSNCGLGTCSGSSIFSFPEH
jgi:hypothetical protein